MKRTGLNNPPGNNSKDLYVIVEKLRRMLIEDGKNRLDDPTSSTALGNDSETANRSDEAAGTHTSQSEDHKSLSRRNDWRTIR